MLDAEEEALRVDAAAKLLRDTRLSVADLTAIGRAIDERIRQVAVEGWTDGHDDTHTEGEIAMAAVCYATPPHWREGFDCGPTGYEGVPSDWPWQHSAWKPHTDRLREIDKATALLLAEGARLVRAQTDGS